MGHYQQYIVGNQQCTAQTVLNGKRVVVNMYMIPGRAAGKYLKPSSQV